MADAEGLGEATIRRIWRQHGLKPHLVETFKLSRDQSFVEKLWDIVGLYLNPPDESLVLCVDERTQIQALDRTQPGLPMKKVAWELEPTTRSATEPRRSLLRSACSMAR